MWHLFVHHALRMDKLARTLDWSLNNSAVVDKGSFLNNTVKGTVLKYMICRVLGGNELR